MSPTEANASGTDRVIPVVPDSRIAYVQRPLSGSSYIVGGADDDSDQE